MKLSDILSETAVNQKNINRAAHEIKSCIRTQDRFGSEALINLQIFGLKLEEIPIKLPKVIHGSILAHDNNLSTFKNFPEILTGPDGEGIFDLSTNNFNSLKDIHKHIKEARELMFVDNPIKSHVLGLLKINGLRQVTLTHVVVRPDEKELARVEGIINDHLSEGDVFACQQELIDAGLEAFAQL